ncbi:MAG: ABC transporter permease [Armatimonadota bacterium]
MIDPISILRYAAPIGFSAVGETAGQRAGIINIGLEGTMLASAFVAMRVSLSTGNPWLGILAGMFAGLFVTLISAVLTISMRQDQVVIGTVFNLLFFGICGMLFEKSNGATGQLLSLPALPKLIWGIDAVLIILILAAGATGYALFKTDWGLKARAAGEYPSSLEAAGFSVARTRYEACAIAGVMAGLGGAYYAIGVAGSFAPDMISGRGFMAIAMVTFARWKPVWGLLAACLLGYFETLQIQLQMNQQGIPKSLLIAIPYAATLLVLVFSGKGAKAPEALGEPYRGMR